MYYTNQLMTLDNFITLDDTALSLEQSLCYLNDAGKLQPALVEIAKQYLLEQEIQAAGIGNPLTEQIEQFMIEFRVQQQLTTPEAFQQWLSEHGLNYATFKHQIQTRMKQDELKEHIVRDKVQEYFEQNKTNLDRIVFSRIVVETPEEAQHLYQQLQEPNVYFSQLAKQHSIVDDRKVGGAMTPMIRGQMPPEIRQATLSAEPGAILGPVQIEGRYCLLKVEEILPARLEGALKRDLQTHLFEEWIKDKLKAMKIQLNFQPKK
ncbi:peptidylprolyl isomerase [Roseofilum sp. BLCC_M91]|uniref:peptidylprolyl isomerase n=1 Tax=Roseofilum halophilum BLCC-M91 TaxID=3022259 RepID=A0ABT7BLP1_9CYAN|nr:peptidylprolyl isomerase [Roseofilum halophilum]MDJ1180117.1 peptidylprolyl isomerase [Roseofilum halophilum BLCC-M91]